MTHLHYQMWNVNIVWHIARIYSICYVNCKLHFTHKWNSTHTHTPKHLLWKEGWGRVRCYFFSRWDQTNENKWKKYVCQYAKLRDSHISIYLMPTMPIFVVIVCMCELCDMTKWISLFSYLFLHCLAFRITFFDDENRTKQNHNRTMVTV